MNKNWHLSFLSLIVSHKSAWLVAVKTSYLGAGNLQINDFVCSLTFYVIANKGFWIQLFLTKKIKNDLNFHLSLFNCIEMCFSFAPHVINSLKHGLSQNPKTLWHTHTHTYTSVPFSCYSDWNFHFVGFGGTIRNSDTRDARWSSNSWGLSLLIYFSFIILYEASILLKCN